MNFSERNARIVALRRNGATLGEIGRAAGLTAEAVRQIIRRAAEAEQRRGREADARALPQDQLLACPIDAFDWGNNGVRIVNALRNEGIDTLGKLLEITPVRLLRAPNFGPKRYAQVLGKVAELGLVLDCQKPPPPPPPDERLARCVDELELSTRAVNVFANQGIKLIGDLVKLSEAELLLRPNFGRKSLNEVKAALALFGLQLAARRDRPLWAAAAGPAT
jgi:DNA-directed RNA polymerase alpha subunit